MTHAFRLTLILSLFAGAAAARDEGTTQVSVYMTERIARFAEWPQAQQRGEQPAQIWECAACPILNVVPGGGVYIGALDWEKGPHGNEGPPVEVKFPDLFAIGRFEVTRGEFAAFAAATKRRLRGKCVSNDDAKATWLDTGFAQADGHPVVCVSFEDAQAYVAWLNTQTPGGYRLLTEAEWEYASRTWTHDLYAWGDSPSVACLYANYAASQGAGAGCQDPWVRTAPVGQLTFNLYELYDLSGNASEWVDGCFVAGKQPAALQPKCAQHIEKGGSWKSPAVDLRPARRTGRDAKYREDSLGFRVAKTLPDSKRPLDTAAAYQQRGRLLSRLSRYEDSRSDFDRALALTPGDATLLAERAEASHWLRDDARERKDVAAALAANPDEPLALTLEASRLLDERTDTEGALARLERAAAAAPWRAFTLGELARARYVSRDADGAFSATTAALQLAPRYAEMFRLRLQILMVRRDWRTLFDVARRHMAINYFSPPAQVDAALAFYRLGLRDAALATMKVAIALDANVTNYFMREQFRARDDIAGRRADLQAALEIDPDSKAARYLMAVVEADSGNPAGAVDAFTAVMNLKLDARQLADSHLRRGIEYSKLGQPKLADADFTASIDPPDDPRRLNDLCWELTVAGIEYERATRACKRALELEPRNAAILDSRAWLLLRQNRFEDAISAFDAALKVNPKLAASLYGRGIARQQKCGCRDGIDDLNAALVESPSGPDEYSFTGFSPRGTLTPPWSAGTLSPPVP